MPPRSSPSSPPRAAPRRPRNPARPVHLACGGRRGCACRDRPHPYIPLDGPVVRWESAATGIALVLACACNARALAPTVDAGRDASSVSTPDDQAVGNAVGGRERSGRPGGSAGAGGTAGSGRRRRERQARSARRWTRSAPARRPRARAAAAVAVGISCRGAAARVHLPTAGRRAAGLIHPLRQLRRGRREVGGGQPGRADVALVTDGRPRAPDRGRAAAGVRGARVRRAP